MKFTVIDVLVPPPLFLITYRSGYCLLQLQFFWGGAFTSQPQRKTERALDQESEDPWGNLGLYSFLTREVTFA